MVAKLIHQTKLPGHLPVLSTDDIIGGGETNRRQYQYFTTTVPQILVSCTTTINMQEASVYCFRKSRHVNV